MIELKKALSDRAIIVQSKVNSHKRVIETIAKLLSDKNPESFDLIYKALLERERLGSTMVSSNLAIPHASIKGANDTQVAILTLQEPIELHEPDEKALEFVVGVLFPENINDSHRQLLEALPPFFQNPALIEQMRNCHTNEALYKTIMMAHVS